MIDVEIANEQATPAVDGRRLAQAAREVLEEAGIRSGELSIAIVGDAQMHELNRRYLDHDYPTDVLSFVLEHEAERLDGQIIVSSEYAAREAERLGWPMEDELLLYVIHGTLHLAGYDDQTAAAKQEMRGKEVYWLRRFGLEPRYDEAE